ncbi:tetratricopeptide repeat protein [Candidatus Magnetobacterium casense]|uniref:Tetratricopeptide repeat protein n=1 Tax=Candidatus Magnetobacterium casense TaxID=1455061 RepID=A0ABS6RYH4_9BACT|nr:tetratricopeptide repeat protein [Candidatus Magnetobacterium casensis]MBV6341380.1 tetratricopeptide repeat protein [Candidatus Magnetobacterium casensis]
MIGVTLQEIKIYSIKIKNYGVKGTGPLAGGFKGGQSRPLLSLFLHGQALILMILAMLMPLTVHADAGAAAGTKDVFQQASVYYAQGKYDDAIARYEGLLTTGVESGSLYYNLGNCYFKAGDIGRAILSYERAMRLIPHDADLKANYEFVLSQVPGRDKGQPEGRMRRFLDTAFGLLTINGICVMLVVLYMLAIVILIGRLYAEVLRRYAVLLISVVLLLFVVASYVLYVRIVLSDSEAVVLKDKVEARYEPFDTATVFFTLPVGMKVRIQQAKDNWYKVSRPDAKHGWVSKELIGVVNQ